MGACVSLELSSTLSFTRSGSTEFNASLLCTAPATLSQSHLELFQLRATSETMISSAGETGSRTELFSSRLLWKKGVCAVFPTLWLFGASWLTFVAPCRLALEHQVKGEMFSKAGCVVRVGCLSDAVGRCDKIITGFNYKHKSVCLASPSVIFAVTGFPIAV